MVEHKKMVNAAKWKWKSEMLKSHLRSIGFFWVCHRKVLTVSCKDRYTICRY